LVEDTGKGEKKLGSGSARAQGRQVLERRGSCQVVRRFGWLTKNGHPLTGSIFISQFGGNAARGVC
jgi:hypothetical protein